jgi:hypothetical protein
VKAIADYVGQEYTHGGDIRFLVENLEDYHFERPNDLTEGASQYDIKSWKKQLHLYWKRRGIYQDNRMKLFSLVWGQSSKATQSKVETHQNYAVCKASYDSLGLLRSFENSFLKAMTDNTSIEQKIKQKEHTII